MADAIAKVFRVSGKKGQLPTTQQAIHRLRETEEMLNKKSAFLESRIEKEMTSAKKHGMKNKKGMFICSSMRVSQYAILHMCQVKLITHSLRTAFAKAFPKGLKDCLYNYTRFFLYFLPPSAALMALKRKKRLEKQLQQIDGTVSTIEFQRESLENAQTNTEVLKNMSYAAKALKAAHQHL